MMFRIAAVRPDGSIARVVVASNEEAVEQNMPAGAVKIAAPAGVMFGTHIYDFTAGAFRLIGAATGGQA